MQIYLKLANEDPIEMEQHHIGTDDKEIENAKPPRIATHISNNLTVRPEAT